MNRKTLPTEDFKEPETWTTLSALNRVLDAAEGSQLSNDFWETCKAPLAFLRQEFGLTNMQIVVLAIMMEDGEYVTWKSLARYLNCSRMSVMTYSEEIEELVSKRWIAHKTVYERRDANKAFVLIDGVETAILQNKTFVPEKIDGLTEQQFVEKLERHLGKNINSYENRFEDNEEWMVQLVKANPDLPLCHELLQFGDIHVLSLMLLAVYDYAQKHGTDNEGIGYETIKDLYQDDYECDFMCEKLINGDHVLMSRGYIEHKCVDGLADPYRYTLTTRAKNELLSAYKPSRSKSKPRDDSRFLMSHSAIEEKPLYYNDSEQEQIDRLMSLLSVEQFPVIQQRLAEQGMRKGFACLFYGGPGTGKTETVLQIARQTGRDLMQIDIASMRDKWVGETEKNIKEVFTRYREMCRNAEVMPILFFNEADGIFGKRFGNTKNSVDKMENAMQNIILQEMENLEGILIATTNLTCNLDSAFERRFLYKIEFHKPSIEVKVKIWCSMLKDLSEDDARLLATHYDFSGGQIENIARKHIVENILTGRRASFEEIEDRCRMEVIYNTGNKKKEHTRIVGFTPY
jgi:hypothetical protein